MNPTEREKGKDWEKPGKQEEPKQNPPKKQEEGGQGEPRKYDGE
jgi:hypothetical protein